ncbi:hypothetical protein ACEN4K_03885 [Marinilactibacillus psychrotolerans]|uniref:hypothetical protein n=1 Tax=Marinilactibacillus psychrotolerans TaxID=191770 RepID=UPI003883B2BA
MTKIKDVVRLKMPFPNISAGLAVKPHMYLCIQEGKNKRMLSCQTSKPKLLAEDMPPFVYIEENIDSTRNPFTRKTLIACDYYFPLDDIHVDSSLLATVRRNVCQELYDNVITKIKHDKFREQPVSKKHLLKLNGKLHSKAM